MPIFLIFLPLGGGGSRWGIIRIPAPDPEVFSGPGGWRAGSVGREAFGGGDLMTREPL